jgi:hypothetical protein
MLSLTITGENSPTHQQFQNCAGAAGAGDSRVNHIYIGSQLIDQALTAWVGLMP